MRNISFALTTAQFLDGSKSVTSRRGWMYAKAGQVVMGVERGQGLKKGEKVRKLGPIRFVNVRRELLCEMTDRPGYGRSECQKEGFPHLTPAEFIEMFTAHNGGNADSGVSRIEFEHLCVNECGYPVARPGLCGECSCEDDCDL
jgi:hypothetical protein